MTTVQRQAMRTGFLWLWLALSVWPGASHAHDPAAHHNRAEGTTAIGVSALSRWLKTRFTEAELAQLAPEDLVLEPHYCGCYDEPEPHFPYPLVLLKTPKGDLVARDDSREGAVSFAPLAVRHGDRYCEVESEHVCYGTFAEPCDFTDFRYGPHLAPFFPTCKTDEVGSSSPPSIAGRAER
jgi:hypothetical protein